MWDILVQMWVLFWLAFLTLDSKGMDMACISECDNILFHHLAHLLPGGEHIWTLRQLEVTTFHSIHTVIWWQQNCFSQSKGETVEISLFRSYKDCSLLVQELILNKHLFRKEQSIPNFPRNSTITQDPIKAIEQINKWIQRRETWSWTEPQWTQCVPSTSAFDSATGSV